MSDDSAQNFRTVKSGVNPGNILALLFIQRGRDGGGTVAFLHGPKRQVQRRQPEKYVFVLRAEFCVLYYAIHAQQGNDPPRPLTPLAAPAIADHHPSGAGYIVRYTRGHG